MRRRLLIGLVVLAASRDLASQQPARTFRAGIDVLTIEASVVDGESQPVPDLSAGDFEVKVDGAVRRVVSAQYLEASRIVPVPAGAAIPSHVTNQIGQAGRIVAFVVDRDGIGSGSERAVLNAATSMLDALGSADAAGVASLPESSIELTRDKDRVRAALLRMTGTRPVTVLQGEEHRMSWDEALAYERSDSRVIAEVIERECRSVSASSTSNYCPAELKQLSVEMLTVGRSQFQRTIAALRGLLGQLGALRGAKHLVLLSGGLPFGQDLLPWYTNFARDAAAAEVIVHAIHLEAFEGDVGNRKLVSSAFGSRDFITGLATLASTTGGNFYQASGTGAGIFARITSTMSGFYQLGIEITPADRIGASKPIEVKVRREGLSVRYGRRAIAPEPDQAVGADRLTALLKQPTDIGELPIAVASYTMRGDESSTLRFLISLDLGPVSSPVEWGFVAFSEGNAVATGQQRIAAGETAGTLSGKLLPGTYRVRTAAIDAEGRAAVMELPVTVGLRVAGALQLSDLVLGSAADGRLQARSSFAQGEAISGLFEILSADPAVLEKTRAVFEIATPGSAEPLKRYLMAARAGSAATLLNNQIEVQTASLPPGVYIATVIPHVDDRPVGRVSRRFEIVNP